MRVTGYIRVSRVGGRAGPRFISPNVQRERIASWAKASGHEVVAFFEDLDQPGSRLERPGLTEAMKGVEAGESEGIVVARLDRFGRSVVHQGGLIARLREAGGALFTVQEGIDTRGTTGKLVADILGAIAEWELDRIRDNWATARSAAASRGVYLAEAPVGYRKTEAGILELNEWGSYVTEAFRRRVGGESWVGIARWLDGEGVPARRGGGWTVSALRRMVANRAYVGEGFEGATHPPLVDAATFEAANVVTGVAPQRTGTATGVLAGLLRCAGCRYAMKLSQGRSRHGKARREYRCKGSRRESAGVCPAPASVSAGVIEPFVLDAFWREVGDYEASGLAPDVGVDEAEQAVREAEAQMDAVLDRDLADALGGDDKAAYLGLVRERRGAVDEARTALAHARRNAEAGSLPLVELQAFWPDLTIYEQRKLLTSAFDCVFIRRTPNAGGRVPVASRVWICGVGEAPELPVRGRRWTPEPFQFPGSPEAGV